MEGTMLQSNSDQVWAELQGGETQSSAAQRIQTYVRITWCWNQYLLLQYTDQSILVSEFALVSVHTGHSASHTAGSHRKGTSDCSWQQVSPFQPFRFILVSATGGGAVNFTLAIVFSEDTYRLAPTESSLWDEGKFGFFRLHNWCLLGTVWFTWLIGHKPFRYVSPSHLGFLHILLSR